MKIVMNFVPQKKKYYMVSSKNGPSFSNYSSSFLMIWPLW